MKPVVLPILMLLVCVFTMRGNDVEDKVKSSELYLSGGLYITPSAAPAWSLEPEFIWRFHKYLGASFGIEITSQYNAPSRFTTIDDHLANLCGNQQDVGWLVFKPALVLSSPNIWSNLADEKRLWVEVSGGVSLACPFHNSLTYEIQGFDGVLAHTVGYKTFPNKDLQWFYLNSKIQVKFSVDRLILGLGYSWSNLDYYSCRRNVTLENGNKFHVPKKQIAQTVFISIGLTLPNRSRLERRENLERKIPKELLGSQGL